MGLEVSNLAARTATTAGCGIHPSPHDFKLRYPYLEKCWHEQIDLFGSQSQLGSASLKRTIEHTRSAQHLDPIGVLNQHQSGQGVASPELCAAPCSATDKWPVTE